MATTGAAAAPAVQPGAPVAPQAPNRNAPPQQGTAAPPPAPPAPGAPQNAQPQPPAEGTAFSLLITVANVSQQEIQQLTSRTEQFLRGCAVKVLIARDILDATVFSLTCAISSTTPPERLVHDLQSKHLPQPFVGGPVVLVTKDEIRCLDDSACDRFRQMCSEVARWTMIYDGPGAEAERADAGSLVPLFCSAPGPRTSPSIGVCSCVPPVAPMPLRLAVCPPSI